MDLVFSDIHSDIWALEAILEVASKSEFEKRYGSFSRILNLGDVLERGTHPKMVLTKLQELSSNYTIESVIGNHDEAFLYGRKVSGSSLESLDAHLNLKENDLEFFHQNQDGTFGRQEFVDKKKNLLCVHGGPLDPKKITPKDAQDESWLYQKTWQRLTEEEFEFFSYSGFHYKPESAFSETKQKLASFIILCGHQHQEAALSQEKKNVKEILFQITSSKEKISNFVLEKREFPIEPEKNYIIRLGLGGPEGYYGIGLTTPHFGIIEYNPKKVTLFNIISGYQNRS